MNLCLNLDSIGEMNGNCTQSMGRKNIRNKYSPTVMTRTTKDPSKKLFYHLMKAPPGLPTLVGLGVD